MNQTETQPPSMMSSTVGKTETEVTLSMQKSAMDPVESTNPQVGDPQAAGNLDAKRKRKASIRGKRKGKPGKIHIRLPPIEAYQKDLCFAAEAPGRVVVRLERLMGSDKIRPVDGKFMETLITNLEEEEKIAWNRRIRLRKKAEKERYRQLAISGLMEPGPGMEDLYNHPVFRVNRILNRLSSLDNSFSNNPALKLPPIVQIDPFETDDSGSFFKDYPAHRALRKEWEKYRDSHVEGETPKQEDTSETKSYSEMVKSAKEALALAELQSKGSLASGSTKTSSKAQVPATSPPSDLEEEDEYDEELMEEDLSALPKESTASLTAEPTELTEIEQLSNELNREYVESLTALQKKYDVPKYASFEDEWKPFRSELVEKFFSDFEAVEDMYEAAKHLFDVYTRQALVTQDHVKATAKSAQSKAGVKTTEISTTASGMVAPAPSALEESKTVDGEETVPGSSVADDETERNALESDGNEQGEDSEEEPEPVPSLTDGEEEEDEETEEE